MERIYLLLRSSKGSVGILELDKENMPIVSVSTNPQLVLAEAMVRLKEVPPFGNLSGSGGISSSMTMLQGILLVESW